MTKVDYPEVYTVSTLIAAMEAAPRHSHIYYSDKTYPTSQYRWRGTATQVCLNHETKGEVLTCEEFTDLLTDFLPRKRPWYSRLLDWNRADVLVWVDNGSDGRDVCISHITIDYDRVILHKFTSPY